MKIRWEADAGISLANRIFWWLCRPAFWWIDFMSVVSGNGQKYTINFRIGDESSNNTEDKK